MTTPRTQTAERKALPAVKYRPLNGLSVCQWAKKHKIALTQDETAQINKMCLEALKNYYFYTSQHLADRKRGLKFPEDLINKSVCKVLESIRMVVIEVYYK